MDKKKKIVFGKVAVLWLFLSIALSSAAQDIGKVVFCGNDYRYDSGSDSITLYLKVLDIDGNKADVQTRDLSQYLKIYEDGKEVIAGRGEFSALKGIPKDMTFSVLIDQGISIEGKEKIYTILEDLVNSAPDSCVYISFYGDEVSSSILATRQNYRDLLPAFEQKVSAKYFYDALYSKLLEIDYEGEGRREDAAIRSLADDYRYNRDIARRAKENPDKIVLFVFTDGSRESDFNNITYMEVTDYQKNTSHIGPRIYAFYYDSGYGLDENVQLTLAGVTGAKSVSFPEERKGKYKESKDLADILSEFQQNIGEQMYDFTFIYKATEGKSYSGKVVYSATWDDQKAGDETAYSIGTPENPWPLRQTSLADSLFKLVIALLIAFLTITFFFCIMKILIPFIKQKSFAVKYYKPYVAEQNIQTRICHYCKQPIHGGDMVVNKCKHIMHVHCWQQNDYRCAEFGQNCKTGIQEHIEWDTLLTPRSIRDCHQTISGIMAGFVSWLFYELTGRGGFTSFAKGIVGMFLTDAEQKANLFDVTVTKVSAFLMIGMLLGFFLSLVFRFNDEYRQKNFKVYMKIIGLSLLSSLIGFLSFAFGSIIFCMMLSSVGTSFIPWYCALPAYLLFSICTSLSLTIKSSIPVQSAMLGGLCSAIIGFLVLYFTSTTSTRYSWMNMLLDFIIYGGGLGASLVTVRMLAEKYFLVIQNGIKAGTRIPIHKWMNATGGGNKVSIGMTGDCEIQMNWEKSNKVAKEHAVLFIDHSRSVPVIKPLATGVNYNSRAELPVGKASILTNGDTFKIGDTIFRYEETD